MSAHRSPERDTDGFQPQVVHRRIHVGDTVRVTGGAHQGRTGTVTTLDTTSADVRFNGDGDWTVPKRWLEPIGDGTGRVVAEWDRAEADGVRIGIDSAVKLVGTFRDSAAAKGRDGVAAVLDEITARLLGAQ